MNSHRVCFSPEAKTVLALLEQAGFEAWCVGGCVRDFLLGRAPSDWDVATSARPEEIKSCCAGLRAIDTGVSYGTVTILVGDTPIEVTTFRQDGAYRDARHPEGVSYSRRLEDDLSRRDFTVNALACHPQRGLVDLFGGLSDLREKRLRCVGKPETRFSEDALRILRCLRFASVLGFSIDPSTQKAAHAQSSLLSRVSPERIREELTRLLLGQSAAQILEENSAVLFAALPELAPMEFCTQESPYHCFDVWRHTLHALKAIPADPLLRWAALLHDCGKPQTKSGPPGGPVHFYGHAEAGCRLAAGLLKRLRFSNREAQQILDLISLHGEPHPIPEKRLKKLLARLGEDQLFRLLALSRADLAAAAPHLFPARNEAIRQSEIQVQKLIEEKPCLTLRGLAVTGKDLLALGFSPSRELGAALNALLEQVLDDRLPNEPVPLLREAERILKQKNSAGS